MAKTIKTTIKSLRFIGSYWENFKGYVEALVVIINGKNKYFIHRYYEHHIPLFKRVQRNGSFYPHPIQNHKSLLNKEDNGEYSLDTYIIPNEITPNIGMNHELLEFKTLEEMLESFPGDKIDGGWVPVISLYDTKLLRWVGYHGEIEFFGDGFIPTKNSSYHTNGRKTSGKVFLFYEGKPLNRTPPLKTRRPRFWTRKQKSL